MKFLQNNLPNQFYDFRSAKIEFTPNGFSFEIRNDDGSLWASNTLNFSDIKHDCTVYVIDTNTCAIHHLFAETFETKQTLRSYISTTNSSVGLILIVPVASDTTTYTMIVRDPDGTKVILPEGISYQGQVGKDAYLSILPKLKMVGAPQIDTAAYTPVSIQLCDSDGTIFPHAEVTLYAEPIAGSIESVRAVTDVNGVAIFKCKAASDNTFRAKFGFRYFTGLIDINQ